jgi:hypothetical protein
LPGHEHEEAPAEHAAQPSLSVLGHCQPGIFHERFGRQADPGGLLLDGSHLFDADDLQIA